MLLDAPRGPNPLILRADPMNKDETVSSFIDRVGASYGLSRLDLFKTLDSSWQWSGRSADVDRNLPRNINTALGSALGLEAPAFPLNLQSVPSDFLAASWRNDYCPLCFQEDLASHRTPYFRWQWASESATCCHFHGTPLVRWRRIRKCGERVLPLVWTARPSAELAQECGWLRQHVALIEQAMKGEGADGAMMALVTEFEGSLLSFRHDTVTGQRECLVAWPELVARLRALGASMVDGDSAPLAARLLPNQTALLHGPLRPPKNSKSRGTVQTVLDPSSVGWRRTLNWFAARALFGDIAGTGNHASSQTGGREWLEGQVRAEAAPEVQDIVDRTIRLLTLAADQPHGGRSRGREPDSRAQQKFLEGWASTGSAPEQTLV